MSEVDELLERMAGLDKYPTPEPIADGCPRLVDGVDGFYRGDYGDPAAFKAIHDAHVAGTLAPARPKFAHYARDIASIVGELVDAEEERTKAIRQGDGARSKELRRTMQRLRQRQRKLVDEFLGYDRGDDAA